MKKYDWTAQDIFDASIQLDNDSYGNPRHYFGYPCFKDAPNFHNNRLALGLVAYRGKKFGAGYVLTSYLTIQDCELIIETIS